MILLKTPVSLEKIEIQIRELLRHLEQCIYPLELNRKQKYSTYCIHIVHAFKSIYTCFASLFLAL